MADFIFLGSLQMVIPWKESYDQPRQHIKKQRHYSANKGLFSQGYGFSSGQVWVWELDYKESWAPKNWCFWTVVLEKTLEGPLDNKEIQPVQPKGNQSWIFIGRTDVEAETPILWPPDANSWLIGKDPDAWRDWGREEKGMTEDEMVGWHHRLDGRGFGWTPGVGDGQRTLHAAVHGVAKSRTRLSDWTELNWISKNKEDISLHPGGKYKIPNQDPKLYWCQTYPHQTPGNNGVKSSKSRRRESIDRQLLLRQDLFDHQMIHLWSFIELCT